MRSVTVTVSEYNSGDEVEVELDDVLSELSSYETQQLVDDLYNDGYYQTELERDWQVMMTPRYH